jgi:hypothetical protein
MERIPSTSVISDHEIIYKNDKPYIILDLKEYERLVHSSKTVGASNLKVKNKSITKKKIKTGHNPSGKDFMKGLEGIWKDRTDIIDSVEFVNKMRKKNSIRPHIKEMMKGF